MMPRKEVMYHSQGVYKLESVEQPIAQEVGIL